MKRRGFLGLLAGAAAAPVIPDLLEPIRVERFTHVAPLLPLVEPPLPVYSSALMSTAFKAELAKGLNEVFAEHYARMDTDWPELFDEEEPVLYGFGSGT